MKIILDRLELIGEYEEWEFFLKLIDVMNPAYVLGILEHYDPKNWL